MRHKFSAASEGTEAAVQYSLIVMKAFQRSCYLNLWTLIRSLYMYLDVSDHLAW